MSNPRAEQNPRVIHAIIMTMLSMRSQARPIMSRKAIRRELEHMGYSVTLDNVRRHVQAIRGKGTRNL